MGKSPHAPSYRPTNLVSNAAGNNAGLVDVAIEDSSGATLSLDQAYRYIDLGDLSLSPEDGAVAGNTALRLSGPNLAQTVKVLRSL